MRMYDIIEKKRDGKALEEGEIRWLVREFTEGRIPDYQMSAFLMAVYFQGMTPKETSVMTDEVAHSGDMADLSSIPGIKVDKHSTGGVGDKTTLVVIPMVAAAKGKVAKMSGRGLGHTGGTIDKLEAIPGFSTELPKERFFEIVNTVGASVIGQSGNLTPADKKMYALRDVTATVESIPLIAVSIMGKKLAAGSDRILLDVKVGSGAFMKTREEAERLARTMVEIGEAAGKRTVALLTNMDEPLGYAVGNALEVEEAVRTLKGEGPKDLQELCVTLAANMLYLSEKGSLEECGRLARETLENGTALESFLRMVEAQGGDRESVLRPELLPKSPVRYEVKAKREGYLKKLDAKLCGEAAGILGAGRETIGAKIDHGAGILLRRKTGEFVKKGEALAVFYTWEKERISEAEERFLKGIAIGDKKTEEKEMVLGRVGSGK